MARKTCVLCLPVQTVADDKVLASEAQNVIRLNGVNKMGKNEYDDPYVMLAHHLLSVLMRSEIVRVLTDNKFVYKLVLKETRLQDFSGAFLDCVIQSLLDDKKRMEFMHELDSLSKYFYKNLDITRLRKEVEHYAVKYKILEEDWRNK